MCVNSYCDFIFNKVFTNVPQMLRKTRTTASWCLSLSLSLSLDFRSHDRVCLLFLFSNCIIY